MSTLTIALVSDVFFAADGAARLRARLREAREGGAELVILPELPLNSWSPATPNVSDADAEPPSGPRTETLRQAARDGGVAVLGGVIQCDLTTLRRHNTALLVDSRGEVVASYRKLHLPEEGGFHETHHYEPGDAPPDVIRRFAMPLGIQICSDTNRPLGTYRLAAQGAEAILIPRATEAATFDRWRLVLQANALVSSSYVVSVNRPRAEQGVPLGGPSIVVSPNGDVVLETIDTVAIATLDSEIVAAARRKYPGYLPWRFDLFGQA
jgi:N-carbamoylputrescine amidase